MPPCDYLEVQVNEEHTFVLRQKPLVAFCGRIAKIFQRAPTRRAGTSELPQILLHDFPGGARAFELAAVFCYNGGTVLISHSNVCLLRCVAEFLEMTEDYQQGNLLRMTEVYLRDLPAWDWDNLLAVLRGCESVYSFAKKAYLVQRCADALARKICSVEDTSPVASSPDSAYRAHSGSISRKSAGSTKLASQRSWWFADLASLPPVLMEQVMKSLIYNDADSKLLARFLTHYLRTYLPVFGYNTTSTKLKSLDEEAFQLEKAHLTVLEVGVNLLFRLERGATSCRFLFGLFRIATVLNASKACKRQLEKMIGSQLHVANLDGILVPACPRSGSLYDVDLVHRLVVNFFKEQEAKCNHEDKQPVDMPAETPSTRVGDLIDSYLAEIAPDVHLEVHKFRKLAQILPASARWTHDGLYRAVDIYLEAHPKLSSAEVSALCKVIDTQKLSIDASQHISKNPRLPPKFALQVVLLEQSRIRDALAGCFRDKPEIYSNQMVPRFPEVGPRSGNLKSELQQLDQKVAELEKACKSIRTDVSKHKRVARRLLC